MLDYQKKASLKDSSQEKHNMNEDIPRTKLGLESVKVAVSDKPLTLRIFDEPVKSDDSLDAYEKKQLNPGKDKVLIVYKAIEESLLDNQKKASNMKEAISKKNMILRGIYNR